LEPRVDLRRGFFRGNLRRSERARTSILQRRAIAQCAEQREGFRFEPAKPTSLLYRRRGDGGFELIGAMYADRARASEDDLDRRIPLSVAHWHEHVNWCVPPRGETARWRETRNGAPVFGPKSPIVDATACAAVGGRFLERIFGWMVHVQAFASDDPAVIWSGGHDHEH